VVLYDRSQFRDHRLTRAERLNWRFLLALAGAVMLLVAYLLPFFDARISAATTTFEEDPAVALAFPVLVHGQHATHAQALRNGSLKAIDLSLETLGAAQSTGMAWLVRSVAAPDVGSLVSFIITMSLPLVSAALALLLVFRSWTRKAGIAEGVLPLAITLGVCAIVSLVLAWCHQFDFSGHLLALSTGALLPVWGFWVALAAALVMTLGLWSLHYETRKALLNWWALAFVVALVIWLLIRVRPFLSGDLELC
jgi:hypothetical protein